MCATAMKKLISVSNWKWNKVMKGGETTTRGGDSIVSRRTELAVKKEKISGFLSDVKNTYAEMLPNSTSYDLPTNSTPTELLRMYKREKNEDCSLDYFRKVWKVKQDIECQYMLNVLALFSSSATMMIW